MPNPPADVRKHSSLVLSPTPLHRDKNYKPYRCVFCERAHAANGLPKPATIAGPVSTMEKHFEGCPFATAADVSQAPLAPGEATADLKPKLERWLIDVIAEHNIPATWIESATVRALLERLCPGITAYLPNRRALGGRILTAHAIDSYNTQRTVLKKQQDTTGGRVNLLSDVWQNIAKRHLLGCQLTLFGSYLTEPLRETGSHHDGVAHQLDDVLRDSVNDGWRVGSVVTDNAAQCGRARRILTLRWRDVVFLHCMAHDMNNLVKAVLTKDFAAITDQASRAVNCLNASSSKWLVEANIIMARTHGKQFKFHTLCATRWNSMQFCFASLLRVRTALGTLYNEFHEASDFPDALRVFGDPVFWHSLAQAERIISPLSEASYRLQRDENTVADVVVSFRDIYFGFATESGVVGQNLVACVEARWDNCEQPLFILGFFLHPEFHDDASRVRPSAISSRSSISDFAVYYYRRLIGDGYGTLRDEVTSRLTGGGPVVRKTDFANLAISYWEHCRDDFPCPFPKLSKLAIVGLSIAVNTATCERLFSELGAIHSRNRNRMDADTSRNFHLVRQRKRDADAKDTARAKKKKLTVLSPTLRRNILTGAPSMDQPDEAEDALPEPTDEDRVLNTFAFWQETLAVIFEDPELREAISDPEIVEEDAGNEGLTCRDPYEEIPPALQGPFPPPGGTMIQERALHGIRSIKASLSSLFPIVLDGQNAYCISKVVS